MVFEQAWCFEVDYHCPHCQPDIRSQGCLQRAPQPFLYNEKLDDSNLHAGRSVCLCKSASNASRWHGATWLRHFTW